MEVTILTNCSNIYLPQITMALSHSLTLPPTLMVIGGRAPKKGWLASVVESNNIETIIAADRGLDALRCDGIVPTLMMGDDDSVSDDALTWANEKNIIKEKFSVEKDYTDTQLVLQKIKADSVRNGNSEHSAPFVIMAASFGGRLDHALANVFSLIGSGLDGMMADDREMLLVMRQNDEVSVRLDSAPLAISLIALSPICDGVTITGTHWPLHDAVLKAYEPYAVSNKLKKESDGTFTVALKNGILGLYICLNQ